MAFTWACPCSVLSMVLHRLFRAFPDYLNQVGAGDVGASVLAGFTFILGFLVVFRSQQAYARWWEGGTLLQQLRGEWFNAYSNLMAFCNSAPEKQQDVLEFQHRLVRLMSLLYCAAIQQVSTMKKQNYELIDIKDFNHDSLQFLTEAHDRCEVCLQWIQRLIGEANETQVIKVSPPILSRVYNQLGNGIVNLNNARKITEFPIPFPLAQMITFMLLFHWGITAFVCAASVQTTFWAGLISFIVVFSFWSINYIAVELEQPFGDDANDLPLHDMQEDMNKSLKQLLKEKAQQPPTFNFKQEHKELRTSNQGLKEIMEEDARMSQRGMDFVEDQLSPPSPRDVCFDFDSNTQGARQRDPIAVAPSSSWMQLPYGCAHGQFTELDEQHKAIPPMLHVTSTVDLNSGSSCDGMNQGFRSGKPEQQPIPPKMESSSPPSQHAEYRHSCTCEPGRCTCKKPPSLGTVRRPGCSPRIGKHANVVASASNGPQIDANVAAVMTPSTGSNGSVVTTVTLSI